MINTIIALVKEHDVLSFEEILVFMEKEHSITPTELYDMLLIICHKKTFIHEVSPSGEHLFIYPKPIKSPDKDSSIRAESQRTFNEILVLMKEFGDQCPKNVLYTNLADSYNYSEECVDKSLAFLKENALIYYPAEDYIKTTG